MGGESGTSHMGNTYYYYKCGNAKRHGKAHCDLKAIRKEPLERFVVDTAIKVIFSDEIIERLIDLVMEAQQQENTRLPVLKDQLRDTEKRLANLLEAIEQGILTPTTKQRLDELEARKEALNTSILEEELKKPVLTREWIRFWLEKFRKGDVGSTEHQRQIIDTFVNSVYVFDDRVVLNFNFTDDSKTISREEVLGSSVVENAPPYCANPNSIFFVKRCFGFVFVLEDVDQSTSSFFRHIVSKRLFSIPDASRDRVAPANPRAAYMRPLRRSKKQKAAYLKRDKRLLAGLCAQRPNTSPHAASLISCIRTTTLPLSV